MASLQSRKANHCYPWSGKVPYTVEFNGNPNQSDTVSAEADLQLQSLRRRISSYGCAFFMINLRYLMLESRGWLTWGTLKNSQRLEGEVAICSARLLSVSRQVGAHLWHEGPAGGLIGIESHNLSTLACLEVQTVPLSHLLLSVSRCRLYHWAVSYLVSRITV